MGQPSSAERRRAPRIEADLPLTLTARDAGAPAHLKDLSELGLCCTFPEPVPEMTLVRVGLEIESQVHDLDGAVVRCEREPKDGWEVAIYFTGMDDAARSAIGTFVKSRVPNTAGA